MKTTEPIDFVIPWVDGSDPAWLAEKANYTGSSLDIEDSAARYRDWGLLRHWFRGIEKFAPWVNKVHFITWGHLPEWLNLDHPKLNVVRHEDYIPQEYLPTFSANTIELNLHRIDELSEHFVYFNDDTFLIKETKPTDFFVNGRPKLPAVATPLRVGYGDWFFMSIVNNAVINQHFNFHKTLRKNFFKWFNPAYGVHNLRTLTVLPYPYFLGMMEFHLPNPLTKQAYREVWEAEGELLGKTCAEKVRSTYSVNQYLIKNWLIAKGEFVPRSTGMGKAFQFREDAAKTLSEVEKYLARGRGKMVCINDSAANDDFQLTVDGCKRMFDVLLPDVSGFEA